MLETWLDEETVDGPNFLSMVVFASSLKSSLEVSLALVIHHPDLPSESFYSRFDYVCVFLICPY
jgi:hypothetical protein